MEQTRLNVVIVGAGLAGLACAIALGGKGHRIVVLERNETLSETGAGIQIPPNSARVLYQWGLKERLEAVAEPATPLVFRQYGTGKILSEPVKLSQAAGYP